MALDLTSICLEHKESKQIFNLFIYLLFFHFHFIFIFLIKMGFMLSNIAQNAHSYGFRVSGLVSRDTLLKISFSEVWMQTSLSFQPLYLLL